MKCFLYAAAMMVTVCACSSKGSQKAETNVAEDDSKPIYVIPTNEAAYMIKKAGELLDGVA